MVKTSFVPMMAVELLYRRRPDLLKMAYFGNTAMLTAHADFQQFEEAVMTAAFAGKVEYTGRFRVPWFLSDRVDVVLSHQWGNPMNYLYLDTMWLGYPLVHNSPYHKVRVRDKQGTTNEPGRKKRGGGEETKKVETCHRESLELIFLALRTVDTTTPQTMPMQQLMLWSVP